MGVQGRMNPEGAKAEDQVNAGAAVAIDQKRRAQETANSIREQVREKLKAHYEGST